MSIFKSAWLWLAVVLLIEFTICYAFLSYAVPQVKPSEAQDTVMLNQGQLIQANELKDLK